MFMSARAHQLLLASMFLIFCGLSSKSSLALHLRDVQVVIKAKGAGWDLATDGNCSDACSSWRASPPNKIKSW